MSSDRMSRAVVMVLSGAMVLGALGGCGWFEGEEEASEASAERPTEPPAAAVAAADLEARVRQMSYDLNNDGAIDANEAASYFARRFARLDQDGDGRLSRSELATTPNASSEPDQLFETMDEDGDGVVTQDEFFTAGAERFKAEAETSEGKLSPQDFDQLVRDEEKA